MYTFTHTQSITPLLDPVDLYEQLIENENYSFLYESAEYHRKKGRYTFMGFSTQRIFNADAGLTHNFFDDLKNEIKKINTEASGSVFPHSPALFGYISFEAARFVEGVQMHESQSTIPDAILFEPALYIVVDHTKNMLTIHAATQELLKSGINAANATKEKLTQTSDEATLTELHINDIPLTQSESFRNAFNKAKEYIESGDLMQVVISQRFEQSTEKSPLELYKILKKLSPSPYQYLLTFPKFSIIGSSPETLVRVENGTVITRPIAGTRRRGITTQEDEQLAQELLIDEKERAEHAMLVDLGRNDLGKVCEPGSVTVTHKCDLEKFSTVMHLVSEVCGKLRSDKDCVDAFTACFPAGTLSGAPKKRALERIIELENTPRGIYGGAVGYIDCTGSMDFAIAIRTMLHTGTSVLLQAGAGIVADSQAQNEDAECRNKMKAPYYSLVS